jgi:hypothetical protein
MEWAGLLKLLTTGRFRLLLSTDGLNGISLATSVLKEE